MPNSSDLTDQAHATREALLVAARRVFESDGFDGATISQIVHTAGVARGTFYLYFDSKEKVLMEIAERVAAEISTLQRRFDPESEPSPMAPEAIFEARIEQAIRRFLAYFRQNARMMAVLEHVASHHPVFRDLRREMRRRSATPVIGLLRNLADEGPIDPRIDPRHAAFGLTGMVDRFAYVWLVLGEEFDEETAVRTLTRLWVQAVAPAAVHD